MMKPCKPFKYLYEQIDYKMHLVNLKMLHA